MHRHPSPTSGSGDPAAPPHPARTLHLLVAEYPGAPESVEGYEVQAAGSWAELAEQVRTAAPSSVALVRVASADEAAVVRGLMRATPSVPVVAAVPFGRAGAEVAGLLDAGISEIVNVDLLRGLAGTVPTLRRAHARPLKRRVEAGLPVWVPEEARTLLRAAAETVADQGGRTRLAAMFGVYVRTVGLKCRELQLPPPRRLLGWVRVLMALSLLEEKGRTVMNVARVCGYGDNSSLKRAIGNFGGGPAVPTIRHQSFTAAWDGFVSELRGIRYGIRGRGIAGAASAGRINP